MSITTILNDDKADSLHTFALIEARLTGKLSEDQLEFEHPENKSTHPIINQDFATSLFELDDFEPLKLE